MNSRTRQCATVQLYRWQAALILDERDGDAYMKRAMLNATKSAAITPGTTVDAGLAAVVAFVVELDAKAVPTNARSARRMLGVALPAGLAAVVALAVEAPVVAGAGAGAPVVAGAGAGAP